MYFYPIQSLPSSLFPLQKSSSIKSYTRESDLLLILLARILQVYFKRNACIKIIYLRLVVHQDSPFTKGRLVLHF